MSVQTAYRDLKIRVYTLALSVDVHIFLRGCGFESDDLDLGSSPKFDDST